MAGCICDHGTVIVDPGGPVPCEDCLYVTSHIVACDDGVGPCGETGTVTLTTNCVTPTFTVIYNSPELENVSISLVGSDWVLTYDTVSGDAIANTYYEIVYKVACSSGDFSGLSVIGTVQACVKNFCQGVICPGEECDPCTGDCVPVQINLGLTIN